jgi:amino acid adenylation domain-containing protein
MQQSAIVGFRLSPQQARLWQLQEVEPDAAYRADCAIQIEGDLDDSALREALADVFRRHEILRTTFRRFPGMRFPLQVIAEPGMPVIRECDLSAAGPEHQQAQIETLRYESGQGPLDLEQGPLVHLTLARLSTERHLLLLGMPSLCADAGTLPTLARDISRCYAARTAGETLLDEPLQYADCAEWLNELQEANDQMAVAGKEYWRRQDFQALAASRLPRERSTSQRNFRVGRLSVQLEPELIEAVDARSAERGSSISLFLLACWQVLLARVSGQLRTVVGWVHDGRGPEELEGVLGPLAKHLPLRCELSEDLRFDELLSRVGDSVRQADQWQAAFSWTDVGVQSGKQSLQTGIPVCFEFEAPEEPGPAAGVTFSLIDHQASAERFEAKLRGVQRGDRLVVELHCDTGIFSQQEVGWLAERLQTILADAALRPDATIGELEVVGHAERHRLLVQFNDQSGNQSGGELPLSTVHGLIERQAAKNPQRTAVVCGEDRLTYAELEARANQLARQLRDCGIGPEVPVGLYFRRSTDMAVGVLGVLKAGGAWLPLDPGYPKDRLAFLLRDASVPVVVTHQQLLEELPPHDAQVISLERDLSATVLYEPNPKEKAPDRSNLAYLVYTSGSTGLPKGAMVTHGNVGDYVQSVGRAVGVTEEDICLHTASFGFSSAVRQLLVPLVHGAAVVVATSEEIADPVKLFETIRSEGVTIIDIVPSYWHACVETLGELPSVARQSLLANRLRLILSASEPLPSDLPRKWKLSLGPETELVNMFGLTETTGIVARHRISARDGAEARVIPVGRPIDHNRIHVLDPRLRPVPIGAVGEIYVAGAGVSRGYLNQTAATAETFVPYPFGLEPGARMCRTGDLGRYLQDGTIEFVARVDQQLKIRGFRVEPGEIESALREHPGVEAAIVVGQEAPSGERRVVSYIVPRAPAPNVADLQEWVTERLPWYMVPSVFVFLEALPLTARGKIDRSALPELNFDQSRRVVPSAGPRTATEEVLAKIWAEVLGIERVGVHDDLFALGSHSLIVTQAVARIRRALTVELPVETVFESPTVAELALMIDRLVAHGGTS